MALYCVAGNLSAAEKSGAPEGPPPRPAIPEIQSLVLEPASLALENGRDARKAIVWGVTAAGEKIDLTGDAKLEPGSPNVSIDSDGYVHGVKEGEGKVAVSFAGRAAELPVTVKSAAKPPVRFVRDIMPIMAKVGCNQGTCHGSAKGKNGFKLSLRGYDADFDYRALVDDLSGRRFNRVAPDQSLMLLKPSAGVPHEGGQVLKPDSEYYKTIRQWIAEGLKPEVQAEGRANKIEVIPSEINLALPGMTQQVLVIARYADGTTRDVTREAVFTSNNIEVAAVKGNTLTALRRGEAAVLIRYEGNYATAPMTVMGDRTGYAWADQPEFNYIDGHVDNKLKKMKIEASAVCGDAEFIRRVSLDLTGLPPTPDRARAFILNPAPMREKREKLVDELIASNDYTEFWTNKWADLLQCNSTNLGEKGVWLFRNWLRDSVAANKPYDQFVRDILSAEGSAFKNPAASYYRVLRDTGKMTEDVSQTFLGVRFNCAKCHDHPFEQWTQNQYYQFGAYFARVGIKRGQMPGEEIIYTRYDGAEVQHPKTGMNMTPHVPYGHVEDSMKDADRRAQFVAWLTSKENPYFAKSMSNRVWSYFFGRGIIDPVDDIRSSNPPSNPELLDALTKDFLEGNFNVRALMKTICMSRTYQSSIRTTKFNEDDKSNFSHAVARRLSAEQLLDSIAMATGKRVQLAGLPAGMRAAEVPDGMVKGNEFLQLFGRPMRKSACECERTSNLSLSHALSLINGGTIGDAADAP
ncbi:DUF1549 domain-containing protein, partial [Candidatus Sumerlaeota bacterium]|nr:DUF1549 domain-containing protein [Candidatus Sumerlaeota bacterium]